MKLAHCVIPVLYVVSSLSIQVVHSQAAPEEADVPVREPRRALAQKGPELAPETCPNNAEPCAEGPLDNGYMDAKFLIKIFKIPKGSSCSCCALCRQHPECFSQAFNGRTGECRLYREVASYTTFTRDDDWKYAMSGHSGRKIEHERFCRLDSDCHAGGDACRGRICTTQKTVLCSTIYDVFMRRGASGKGLGDEIIDTYGWIDGKEKRIACMLNHLSPGYTVVFRNRIFFKFNDNTVRHYNDQLKDGVVPYSNLDLAERLRQLTTGGTYRLQVYSTVRDSAEPVSLLQLDVPKQHEVIGSEPRPASTHNVRITDLGCEKVRRTLVGAVSLPYLARVNGPHQGHGKLNKQNGLLSLHSNGAGWGTLGLARAGGAIHLFDGKRGECALLMRD